MQSNNNKDICIYCVDGVCECDGSECNGKEPCNTIMGESDE